MDNWKRTAEQRKRGWLYLLEDMAADMMLLRECVPADDIDDCYNVLFRGIGGNRPWGSAIVTKELAIKEIEFKNSYPGAVIAAEVTLPDGQPLIVISLANIAVLIVMVCFGKYEVLQSKFPWSRRCYDSKFHTN